MKRVHKANIILSYCQKFQSKSMDSNTNTSIYKIHENLLDKKLIRRFIFQHLATHKQFQIIIKKKKLIIKHDETWTFSLPQTIMLSILFIFTHSCTVALNPFPEFVGFLVRVKRYGYPITLGDLPVYWKNGRSPVQVRNILSQRQYTIFKLIQMIDNEIWKHVAITSHVSVHWVSIVGSRVRQ